MLLCVFADKKVSGKSKDEQMAEKKQELEKRLQDVTGQLGNVKKTAKKGMCLRCVFFYKITLILFLKNYHEKKNLKWRN